MLQANHLVFHLLQLNGLEYYFWGDFEKTLKDSVLF